MRRIIRHLISLRFIIAVILLFCIADTALSFFAPVETSALFSKNDYEKTVISHNGISEFENVIYGNSAIITAFKEDASSSGYINFGIVYGTMTDLKAMLEHGFLTVDGNLVIALNYFVFLDTMDTNPTYPWHRRCCEPYLYFQRDRIHAFITTGIRDFLSGNGYTRYEDLSKTLCYGTMTDQELDEKITSHSQLYWGLGPEYYSKNLSALSDVISFCSEKGIRLRAVWMPWNGYIDMPDNPRLVCEAANEILSSQGIDVLDLTNALSRDCFYDLGHLNYDYGADVFTEEIDKWLVS